MNDTVWYKTAHSLYESYRVQTDLFELLPLSLHQFQERHRGGILLFPSESNFKCFALYTSETDCTVIRTIIFQNNFKNPAVMDQFVSFLEKHFTETPRILYLIPSTDSFLITHFEKQNYTRGLKRLRMIAPISRIQGTDSISNEFSVRPYGGANDRRNFATIMNATFCRLWNHKDISEDVVTTWDQDPSFDPKGYLFLLKEGSIIGFVAVSIEGPVSLIHGRICTLHEIGVLPDYRGQHLASYLLKEAVAFASSRKADVVFLNVDEKNFQAIRFYEKAGFETIYAMHTYYSDQ